MKSVKQRAEEYLMKKYHCKTCGIIHDMDVVGIREAFRKGFDLALEMLRSKEANRLLDHGSSTAEIYADWLQKQRGENE